DAGGQSNIWVLPFPATANSGKWKVSTTGGTQPRWSSSGKELFYISLDGKMMAVPVVSTDGETFKWGAPQALFATSIYGGGGVNGAMRWDIAPYGRFLINTTLAESSSPPVTVVLNWIALLKK